MEASYLVVRTLVARRKVVQWMNNIKFIFHFHQGIMKRVLNRFEWKLQLLASLLLPPLISLFMSLKLYTLVMGLTLNLWLWVGWWSSLTRSNRFKAMGIVIVHVWKEIIIYNLKIKSFPEQEQWAVAALVVWGSRKMTSSSTCSEAGLQPSPGM